jgi:hypothetical protein
MKKTIYLLLCPMGSNELLWCDVLGQKPDCPIEFEKRGSCRKKNGAKNQALTIGL